MVYVFPVEQSRAPKTDPSRDPIYCSSPCGPEQSRGLLEWPSLVDIRIGKGLVVQSGVDMFEQNHPPSVNFFFFWLLLEVKERKKNECPTRIGAGIDYCNTGMERWSQKGKDARSPTSRNDLWVTCERERKKRRFGRFAISYSLVWRWQEHVPLQGSLLCRHHFLS